MSATENKKLADRLESIDADLSELQDSLNEDKIYGYDSTIQNMKSGLLKAAQDIRESQSMPPSESVLDGLEAGLAKITTYSWEDTPTGELVKLSHIKSLIATAKQRAETKLK